MRPVRLVLALALPIATLHAQASAPDSGARVRVHFTNAGTSRVVTGTLLFQDADSVTLLEEGRTGPAGASPRAGPPVRGTVERLVSVPLGQVTRLEMSTGRHSRVGSGALIGGGIGVGAGVAFGVALANDLCSGGGCSDATGGVIAIGAVTGVVGAAIGALVGLTIHHERWVLVGERPPVHAILSPVAGRTAVGLAIRF